MNNVSIDTIKKLFNSDGICPTQVLLKAVSDFFNIMPKKFFHEISEKIEFISMTEDDYRIYNIEEIGKKSILISFGNLEDLNSSSITGLVAHLFALIDIGCHEKIAPKGQEWLEMDLYSDDIARNWGFKKEIDDLRKIRPQKIPNEVDYPDIVISNSILKKEFNDDVRSILSEYNQISDIKIDSDKFWYVDKFSMFCSLDYLRKNNVKNLYIITNKYKKENLKEFIKNYLQNKK